MLLGLLLVKYGNYGGYENGGTTMDTSELMQKQQIRFLYSELHSRNSNTFVIFVYISIMTHSIDVRILTQCPNVQLSSCGILLKQLYISSNIFAVR